MRARNVFFTIVFIGVCILAFGCSSERKQGSEDSKRNEEEYVQEQDEEESEEPIEYQWVIEPSIDAEDIYYTYFIDSYLGNEKFMQWMNKFSIMKKDGQYGIVDIYGNICVPAEYAAVIECLGTYRLTGDMGRVFDLTKWGDLVEGLGFGFNSYMFYYANQELHNEEIEFGGFSEGGINTVPEHGMPVPDRSNGYDEKWAVYKQDRLVTEFEFDRCGSYSEGLMAVCKDGKWGYINDNGEVIIPLEYDASWNDDCGYMQSEVNEFCYAASEGYIPLRKGETWKLCDLDGNEVIEEGIFEQILPVYEGKCWVKANGKWGVIQLGYGENDSKDYSSSFMKREEFGQSVENENVIHYAVDDYDGDGRQEAFGITGYDSGNGIMDSVRIYFVDSNNQINLLKEDTYGCLNAWCEYGKRKFIVWEMTALGPESLSIIYGVKDGEAYELDISGQFMEFHQEGDRYIGEVSDYNDNGHDYIPRDFIFDEETYEFVSQKNAEN